MVLKACKLQSTDPLRIYLSMLIKRRFRWVSCQLEILQRLGSPQQIHEALQDLPETIEKVYERILIAIPQRTRHICIRTLYLISSGVAFSIEELAEAAVIDSDKCTFSADGRLLTPAICWKPVSVSSGLNLQ